MEAVDIVAYIKYAEIYVFIHTAPPPNKKNKCHKIKEAKKANNIGKNTVQAPNQGPWGGYRNYVYIYIYAYKYIYIYMLEIHTRLGVVPE